MTETLDPKALLAAYDEQLRARPDFAASGGTITWDGPVRRTHGMVTGGFLEYRDLGGIEGDELNALIARQIAFFAELGVKFEWKTRGHDLPADLPDRLIAAGFEPDEQETVVVGLAAPYADASPSLPPGVTVRETTDPADFEKIAELNTIVWDMDCSWLATMLQKESTPDTTNVFVAEADGKMVSAAWVRLIPGTDFAGLWGGSTLAEYRGRGIYRALVAVRAAVAVARGHKYLQVDCSEDSRPILQRLGFVAITTTTPYIWRP